MRCLLLGVTLLLGNYSRGHGAGIGFPLGGDGGQEVWEATVEAVGGRPFDPMLDLIAAGANVNWQNVAMKNFTALHYSAMRGHRRVTYQLIRAGADPHAVSIHGNTPLHLAAMHGYEDIVRELIGAGAEADRQNNQGKTPLDKAYEFEHDYRPKHAGVRHSSEILKVRFLLSLLDL